MYHILCLGYKSQGRSYLSVSMSCVALGTIPSALGQIISLKQLFIYNNCISGKQSKQQRELAIDHHSSHLPYGAPPCNLLVRRSVFICLCRYNSIVSGWLEQHAAVGDVRQFVEWLVHCECMCVCVCVCAYVCVCMCSNLAILYHLHFIILLFPHSFLHWWLWLSCAAETAYFIVWAGPIPTTFANLSYLHTLKLHHNSLNGELLEYLTAVGIACYWIVYICERTEELAAAGIEWWYLHSCLCPVVIYIPRYHIIFKAHYRLIWVI